MLHVDSKFTAAGQASDAFLAELSGMSVGEQGVHFARWLDATGVHHLCALNVDGKKSVAVEGITATLTGDGPARLAAFIEKHNGRNNLYISVNPPRLDFVGYKPGNKDISHVRIIVADKDPEGVGDIERERIEMLETLSDKLEKFPPSAVMDSGNGFWVLYRLKEPLIAGENTAAWYEAQCKGLAKLLESDNVSDPSRIMRLPGTINIPDAVKRSKERPRRQSSMVSLGSRVFDKEEVAKAFPPIFETSEQTDRDPRVRELITEYQGAHWQTVSKPEDLGSDLRARLQEDLARSPKLASLWAGDWSVTKQKGAGGKRNTWATTLGSHGSGYTVDEFAEITWLWGIENFADDYCEQQFVVRQMAKLRESFERAANKFKIGVDVDGVFEEVEDSAKTDQPPQENDKAPTTAETATTPAKAEPQDPFGYGPTERLLDLPANTFPDVIDVWARDTGERMGVPAVYSAVCALATVAASIGNKLWIQPKANDTSWKEPAVLWVVLAEGVGGMKTPSMDAATKPLREVDHESAKEGARKYAEWELLKKTAKGKEAILALPPEPKIKRNVVVDITTEALGAVLADNRSGVLIHQDELAALLGSMDAYKSSKGGDRAKMLKLFNGGSESVDRVGRKHTPIDFWGASMVGGIQPKKLREISDNLDADGLLQRFLPIYGDGSAQSKEEVDRKPDAIAERAYFSVVKRWARASDLAEVKAVVKLSAEAQEVWKPVRGRIRDLSFLPGQSDAWKGHTAKWPGISSRLLLLCHVLEHHEAETYEVDTIPVSAATARRAARLVDYLLANSLRFYSECVGAGETVYDARALAGYLLTKPDMAKITRRDIGDANKPLRTEYERIKRAMQLLTYMGWVVPNTETRVDPRFGPTQWTICPEIHDGRFASYAETERKQRQVAQAQIVAAGKERARIMGAGSVFD